MRKEGECIQCGMCCGDDESGYCEHLQIITRVGEPYSTKCLVYDRLEKIGREGCKRHPGRPEEIYPWYKCGYRFVNDGN